MTEPDGSMDAQSGVIPTMEDVTIQQHTVRFHDDTDETTQKLTTDLVDRCYTEDSEVEFGKFFSRPVEVAKVAWQVNSTLDFKFNPWALWLENPRIANRISNFANFAGNLHLKVVINGNPFYWGGAQLTYMPGGVPGDDIGLNPFYRADAAYYGDKMTASQRLKIMIDPTLSQGGEMILPFFWAHDMFDLVAGDKDELGECWLTDLGTLRHPTLTDNIALTVFAWCDDIKLSSPTKGNIAGLLPQMGKADEYEAGPVEKMAATISKVSGTLSKVPGLGNYAMASKVGADLIGKGAHALGLSRPRQIENTMNYRLVQTGELALTDAFDTSQSLALTAKREVTIDPTTTGSQDVDELSFDFFRTRESLVGTFPWNVSNVADDILYSTPVTPIQAFVAPRAFPPSTTGVTMAPVSFMTIPFDLWRGTLRFRLQIMSSSFHKGRLLLVWDPRAVAGSPEVQVQRSIVLDIGDKRDYTFDIGWGNDAPGLTTGPSFASNFPTATTWRTDGNIAPLLDTSNGSFSVFVLNRLTHSSGSTDPIEINMYMSSPDLTVWSPNSDNFKFNTPMLQPQEGLVPQGGEVEVAQASSNITDGEAQATVAPTVDEKLELVLHGDSVESFRSLIKRFTLFEDCSVTGTGSLYRVMYFDRMIYPIFRGVQTGTDLDVPTTMHAMLASVFRGWRGGMRYKFYPYRFPALEANGPIRTIMSVSRGSGGRTDATANGNYVLYDRSFNGLILTSGVQGDILEFEVPWYAQRWFEKNVQRNTNTSRGVSFRVQVEGFFGTEIANFSGKLYGAAADDFNFFMFVGVPTYYTYPVQ